HVLTLSYANRIDRPAYQDLNPFEYLLDELTSWKGNPFLIPQKMHQLSLSYSHKRTALTASYSYMKDYKTQITDTVSVSKMIMTSRNIGKQQRLSLTLFQGLDMTRWWEVNLNLIGYYIKNDIAFDRYRTFDLDDFAGIFSIQNTIRLPWLIQMELNGSYATRHLGTSNEHIESSGYVDVGFSKSFDDKRWTVSLAVSDIFRTSRWDNYRSFTGFQLWNWGKSESRQIKLNVAYRFGKKKDASHNSKFEEVDRL
ncbi:outer membrane beta-barrel family protein, partial [Bacteroides heparinolyticus]